MGLFSNPENPPIYAAMQNKRRVCRIGTCLPLQNASGRRIKYDAKHAGREGLWEKEELQLLFDMAAAAIPNNNGERTTTTTVTTIGPPTLPCCSPIAY